MTGKDALKAGAWGALFAFLGAFALTATGWLGDVSEWASTQGQAQFPSLSILGYGAVSAAVGATTGAINAGVRWLQSKGWIPGGGPTYGVNASNHSGRTLDDATIERLADAIGRRPVVLAKDLKNDRRLAEWGREGSLGPEAGNA